MNGTMLFLLLLALQDDPVTLVSAEVDRKAADRGDVVRITVKLRIEEKKHIFASTSDNAPTKFVFETPNVRQEGPIQEPKPKPFRFGDKEYPTHEEEVAMSVSVRLGRVPDGPLEIKGRVEGQACDDQICQEMKVPFAVRLRIGGGTATDMPTATLTSATVEGEELTVRFKVEPPGAKRRASVVLDNRAVKETREVADGLVVQFERKDGPVKGRLRLEFDQGPPIELPFEVGARNLGDHLDSLDKGLAEAKRTGKPIFLEFTGES